MTPPRPEEYQHSGVCKQAEGGEERHRQEDHAGYQCRDRDRHPDLLGSFFDRFDRLPLQITTRLASLGRHQPAQIG